MHTLEGVEDGELVSSLTFFTSLPLTCAEFALCPGVSVWYNMKEMFQSTYPLVSMMFLILP